MRSADAATSSRRYRVLSAGTCIFALCCAAAPNCTGKHHENILKITIWQIPRRDLFLVLFLLLIRLELAISQAEVVIVSDAIAIVSAYYVLICLSLQSEHFSNLERKSCVSKDICITDCTMIDSSIALEI